MTVISCTITYAFASKARKRSEEGPDFDRVVVNIFRLKCFFVASHGPW